jgi:hypothetical protein
VARQAGGQQLDGPTGLQPGGVGAWWAWWACREGGLAEQWPGGPAEWVSGGPAGQRTGGAVAQWAYGIGSWLAVVQLF